MRSKILAAIAAGGLLVGAGAVTAVISAPGTASARDYRAEDQDGGLIHRGLGFLSDVLDTLVGEGTITDDQATAVLDAAEEKGMLLREERQALHDQIQGFLADGAITEDEAAQLPEDHPLLSDEFDEAWEDGELTTDEIRQNHPHPMARAFRRGAHLGAMLDDGGIDESEYDSLPDDHPLKQVDVSEYLSDDGVISLDELRQIGDQIREEHFSQANQGA